jgi:uncharacterized protein (DUF433 family)
MNFSERIVINPKIRHGKPIIRGTRVPVTAILGGMAGGMTSEQVQESYCVEAEDVQAALEFAVELIALEEFHPVL